MSWGRSSLRLTAALGAVCTAAMDVRANERVAVEASLVAIDLREECATTADASDALSGGCASLAIPLSGPHLETFENGTPFRETTFDAGVREGPARAWFRGGGLAFTGSYRADRRHGEWTAYRPDGAVWWRGHYEGGSPVPPWSWFAAEGRDAVGWLLSRVPSQCPAHSTLLLREVARAEGVAEILSMCIAEGVPHGPFVRFAADGELRAIGAYHVGAKHGTWIVWSAPDRWEQQMWVLGRRHGEWETWEQGVRVGEYSYRHDVPDGPQREYHPDGSRALELRMVDGAFEGPVRTWWPLGQPQLVGAYLRDRRHGPWRAWTAEGTLRRAGRYRAG